MRIGGEGATNGATIGYDRGFCFPLCLVNPFVMETIAPTRIALSLATCRAWSLRPGTCRENGPFSRCLDFTREVCRFSADGEHFRRSPAFSVPESAQRWANQVRQEGEIEA